MAGLYVHIPFCKRLCNYCDFYKSISLAKVDALHDALSKEMAMRRDFFASAAPATIYFGGGTPTVYSPEMLQALLDTALEVWDCSGVDEITVEANPEDLTDEYLARLAATGFNRLSIGIQSFIDRDLKMMNRRHDSRRAVEAVGAAQRAGFDNISIDLIYGIPDMSLDEWRENIDRAVAMGIQHISAYHLTVEPATVFGKMRLKSIDEGRSADEYAILCDTLSSAGFEHYEISNFALPGMRSRHNSGYWSGERYLGIGPSAHSYDSNRRTWVVPSIGKYISLMGGDDIYGHEELSDSDKYNEYVMVSLRTSDGADRNEIERRFGARKLQNFDSVANRFLRCGAMVREGDTWRIPEQKWLVSDSVICEFFDCR